ncbi:MAG: 2-oxo-4-hydroxy-4-carboxy-5-ureidoimidazoline decarboxylase [Betaproteobacteria bacterium]|nr:MAG: 2-oxo-4-hydroxy-4-carboxy-5-ureidoimidazoline decarboxylase [Betaproteobacteria bacterium]
MTLADLNRLDQANFVAALAGIYEYSPWVPERAWSRRPFVDINDLHAALAAVVAAAEKDEQLALIRAHPELAGKAMTDGSLTADSTAEQSRAGLMHCSPAELARLRELNARYNANFGFPFILAVKGYDRAGVIAEFARRVDNDAAEEFAENLRQIDKIARLRLDAVIDG